MTIVTDFLRCTTTSATTIFYAARHLLGKSFIAWEPESIWLELQDQGIDLPEINRDKLQAVITLITTGTFYWDAAVFENTTMAFAHQYSSPEVLQEASPEQLSWAVIEAESLLHFVEKTEPEFDYEPARYAAVSLHRAGYILAPEPLAFAQSSLDEMNRGHHELRDEIKRRWKALDKATLDYQTFTESPVDIQLARLASCYFYVAQRAAQLKQELQQLQDAGITVHFEPHHGSVES